MARAVAPTEAGAGAGRLRSGAGAAGRRTDLPLRSAAPLTRKCDTRRPSSSASSARARLAIDPGKGRQGKFEGLISVTGGKKQ